MVLDMINIVKPFKVLDVKEELDGGQGVNFEVSKTEYTDEDKTTTRTVTMNSYISVPNGEDVDTYLFNYLNAGGWV